MAFWSKRTPLAVGLVIILALVLTLLAVLQYRWIGEIAQAERARLRWNLRVAVRQFRAEFNSETRRVCVAFDLNPEALAKADWQQYAAMYDDWVADDNRSQLVAGLYLRLAGEDGVSKLLRLNPATWQWAEAVWPARLEKVEKQLEQRSARPLPFPGAARASTWRVLPDDFVLVHPLLKPASPDALRTNPPGIVGHLVIELDQDYFRREFLPELARRHFASQDGFIYDVAIVTGQHSVLYQSEASLPQQFFSAPDMRSGIVWDRSELLPPASVPPQVAAPPQGEARRPGFPFRGGAGFPRAQIARRPLALLGVNAANWEVLARHRAGSLEAIVDRSRYRNLAISFGILLLLGASVAVILVAARRAQRLAKLQMEFVAGVSHDLRTPLAVIRAAGDNLAAGAIEGAGPRVREYGELIRGEGRKLSAMIEQMLLYAGLRSGRKKFDIEPVSIDDAVRAALADAGPLLEEQGFTVETEIATDLPAAQADRRALAQVLQNLILNALKYSGSSRWLGMRACAVREGGGWEIRLTVEDRGSGIGAEDLPHIFEPFYRGKNALAAGVTGSGLGLSMVQQSMDAMGGRITASSTPGRGSSFTLHLRALPNPQATGACAADEGSLGEAKDPVH